MQGGENDAGKHEKKVEDVDDELNECGEHLNGGVRECVDSVHVYIVSNARVTYLRSICG